MGKSADMVCTCGRRVIEVVEYQHTDLGFMAHIVVNGDGGDRREEWAFARSLSTLAPAGFIYPREEGAA